MAQREYICERTLPAIAHNLRTFYPDALDLSRHEEN